MIHAISGIRPYVSSVPTVNQQQKVNRIKLEKNQVSDAENNGRISQTSAMTQQTNLDEKLSDAKNHDVKYTEAVTDKPTANSIDKSNTVTSPIANTTVERQQTGKELSPVEKQKIVDQQMEQMAINNRVLHGV